MSDHDPTYASKLTALLRRSQRAPRVFIDAGACDGDFTDLLAREFPDAAIHAFEPNRQQSVRLEARFRLVPRVNVWDVALHERPGSGDLHVHADPGTSSLLARPAADRRYYHSGDRVVASVTVPTIALDDVIDEHAPAGIGLLKLDTQGAELSILRGARRALERASIDVIYTEFFIVPHYAGAPRLGDLIGHLEAFGYTLFDLFKGPYADNGQLRFGDAIFISPTFRARYVDTSPPEP